MATGNGAVLKLRIVFQDPLQLELILTNKRVGAIVLVPILGKGENLLERYDEKARFSVMMPSVLSFTPSSYLLDPKVSRGRTRIFYGLGLTIRPVIDTDDPVHFSSQQALPQFHDYLQRNTSQQPLPLFLSK
jgi:hypothetical protein